jgi:Tripartite tricarboxylate transporter TctB family
MTFSFRHIFNLAVVVLLTIYVITAMGYNPQARLMPLAVSIPILILAIGLFISELRASARTAGTPQEAKGTPGDKEIQAKGKLGKEVNAFLWAISMFIALYLFGFILTTCLFTFLSLRVRSRFGWKSSIGVSVGCLAFLYVVMIYGLNVDLYPGCVMIALRKALYGY